MVTSEAPVYRPLTLASAHAFTRDDYHAMLVAGILGEDDRVELINGQIINQMPIGTLHASVVGRLTMLLAARVNERAVVWVQNPIALDQINEPEPDVALLRPRADFYADAHPAPADVLLIIEVADTSLTFDRGEKVPLYAAARIPEVWLVDLADKSVHVFQEPANSAYKSVKRYRRDENVPIPGLLDAPIAVSDLGF